MSRPVVLGCLIGWGGGWKGLHASRGLFVAYLYPHFCKQGEQLSKQTKGPSGEKNLAKSQTCLTQGGGS